MSKKSLGFKLGRFGAAALTATVLTATVAPAPVQAETINDRIVRGKWGTFKLKMKNTAAEQWRATYVCVTSFHPSRGFITGTKRMDRDTFPGSKGKTRKTNITKKKCPTGAWYVTWELRIGRNWRAVDPDKGLCGSNNWNCGAWVDLRNGPRTTTFHKYMPNSWFKWQGGKKACIKGTNGMYVNVHVTQYHTLEPPLSPEYDRVDPDDTKGKTSFSDCND